MKALYIATCSLREHDYAKFRDHNPIVEVKGKCLYKNGEYSIYKHFNRAYYLLWKNVIIGEYVGVNKELADILANNGEGKEKQKLNYTLATEDIAVAEKYANFYNFKIS